MNKIYSLVSILLFISFSSSSQTPGLIFKTAGTGATVLDPNGDGYTSATIGGFLVDDQAESEISYKPLVVPAVEPVADPDQALIPIGYGKDDLKISNALT